MVPRHRFPHLGLFVLVVILQACSTNLNSMPDVGPVDPARAREAYHRGNQRLSARDYEGSITQYTEAIAADPNLVQAYNNRAIAYCHTGRKDLAIQDLDRAVSAAASTPDRLVFLYNLGTAQLVRGYYPQAAQVLERVVELDGHDRDARINLAVAYTRMEELERAEQLLLEVLAEAPDYLEALANLGIVYDAQGEVDQAFTYYQRALDVNSDHLQTLRNLGMLEVREGLRARAIRHLEAFLRLAPPSMSVARYRSILEDLRE